MKLPAVSDDVLVVIDTPERKLATKVYDLRGKDTVALLSPTENGIPIPVTIGEPLSFEWTTERGVVRADGLLASSSGDALPVLSVRVESTRVVQRREHVRVDFVEEVEIRQTASTPATGQTLDISGGGMRALVDRDLAAGERVSVTVPLPDEAPLVVSAEVIRGTPATGYAFRFVGMERSDHERLVKFVFAKHRREFATVRRS